MSPLRSADQFVQFHLHRRTIAILGVLNEKDHQEGDNGRARIDNQLPSIAKVEERAGKGPTEDDSDSQQERQRMACRIGGPFGETRKQ